MWQWSTPDADGPRVVAVVAASANFSLLFLGTGVKQGRGEGKIDN
jgi:hypothetical protein